MTSLDDLVPSVKELAGLAGIVVAPLVAYFKAMGRLEKDLDALRLEMERDFSRKTDMSKFMDKLDSIVDRLANIEGYLRK
jgi:hypothetical protein